jgi:hypothetical protein
LESPKPDFRFGIFQRCHTICPVHWIVCYSLDLTGRPVSDNSHILIAYVRLIVFFHPVQPIPPVQLGPIQFQPRKPWISRQHCLEHQFSLATIVPFKSVI